MMSDSNNRPYQGQCLCGLIQYEVDEIEPRMGHCHCSMCRKFHGAAFATYGEAKADNFHWVAGEGHLKTYLAPNGTKRQFCGNCGSSLTFVPSDDTGESIEFSLGTLESKIELRPDAHIFTDYRASWYEVSDDLPQFPEGRDSKEKL
jgi:hypothetical protein